ncbi:MAG: hypothetical protein Q7K25_02195 [Actinomycetota bacterium]|nr:hypothetical protein [Actinomycetota bacterium]
MPDTWITNEQSRPRYRAECPLLWRSPGVAQLGEGRLHRVLPLDQTSAQWLLALDGLRTVAALRAEFADREPGPAHYAQLLWIAAESGAIDDAGAMPQAWRLMSVSERDAASADHSAALLTLGSSTLADQTVTLRHSTRFALTGAGVRSAPVSMTVAIITAMRAAGLTFTSRLEEAHLHIIVGMHPVVGAEMAAIEVSQPAIAHLFVAAYGDRAVAGPLVIPGVTSCLRCSYLHTRDADHHWAGVSMQLHAAISRLPQLPIDRLLAQLVASQAARLARAWVDSPVVVGAWRNLAYEIRLPDGAVDAQARPAHPLCQCQWVLEPAVAG